MPQAELSLNGLVGAVETVVESAKRLHEMEERYQAHEASFGLIQQQFQQIQEGSAELQSLAEERLAALNTLSTELKARLSQGEQTLGEAKALLEGLRGRQPSAQLEQTIAVIQSVVEQVQGRQSQLEQALVAVKALVQDNGWNALKTLAEQTAQRQSETEQALDAIEAAQQVEKGLFSGFEKSLNTLRSTAVEIEKRVAQIELSVAAVRATGTDATVSNLQTLDVVRALIQDLSDRQAGLQALVDEVQQTAARAGEQAAHLDEQVARIQQESAQAREAAQSAAASAAQALEKASEPAVAPALVVGEGDQQQASAVFREFLERCEKEHKGLMDHQGRLQAQMRQALENLPALAEAPLQEFLEQGRAHMEQMWSSWLEQRNERMAEMEGRCHAITEQAAKLQESLEKLGPASKEPQQPPEWAQNLELAGATHGSELRFLKTLLWITLAAVGLSYALVIYAVILRS